MKSAVRLCLAGFLVTLSLLGCGSKQAQPSASDDESSALSPDYPAPYTGEMPRLPAWHGATNLYEVNVRQYTPEGTFEAFSEHLPRLKEMGVDTLWLMPIHPISKLKRAGSLGSPYSVQDYRGVNPEFGTMEDFVRLVDEVHGLGMHLIIDWVPNHTGWDHPWISEHPDWYTTDERGEIIDPINPQTGQSWGWLDVADLNYENDEMRRAMIDAMLYWVREGGVDGFRVDVAHGVPADFWQEAASRLYAEKPLFLLAEAEIPELRNDGAFVADYGWSFEGLIKEIARTHLPDVIQHETHPASATAQDLAGFLRAQRSKYSSGYQMLFTSNHDANSWEGTSSERFGKGARAFSVLAATWEGTFLVYGGQEAPLDKRLAFFEKDEIDWRSLSHESFYRALLRVRHDNPALHNGDSGGRLQLLATDNQDVLAYYRERCDDDVPPGNECRVLVVLNLSNDREEVSLSTLETGEGTLDAEGVAGRYRDVFRGSSREVGERWEVVLDPWGYQLLSGPARQ